MSSVIVSLDLGTTGNRALAFNEEGQLIAQSYQEFTQHFPKPGWVEHNPEEILNSTLCVLNNVITTLEKEHHTIIGLGITNQRETTVIWNKHTGSPIYNAIVWQCRRTTNRCQELSEYKPVIKEKTGLILDAYFSATKIEWILNHIQQNDDNLLFGTIDTWLIWHLTNGKYHITDHSNASRTMLYNLHTQQFDTELLSLFNIPENILPTITNSCGKLGVTNPQITGQAIPILSTIGDQQAALFCQCGTDTSKLKNTYGTGLFMMGYTDKQILPNDHLVNTVAWSINNQVTYAIEGSVFIGGAAIQWIRDGLKIITNSHDTDALARQLNTNDDVYFVPALSGLGTPHWDPNARGMIIGLTRGTTQAHIARAALESMAYQTADVFHAISDHSFNELHVDGGATANPFLMQFQADILGIPVIQPTITETTAFGAAALAGIAADLWDIETVASFNPISKTYSPKMDPNNRNQLYQKWTNAVQRCLEWV